MADKSKTPIFWNIHALLSVIVIIIIITLLLINLIVNIEVEFSDLNKDNFGQLGDYLGGVITPVLTFITILILLWQVRIQKKELTDATEQYKRSAEAQENLVLQSTKEYIINQNLAALIRTVELGSQALKTNVNFSVNRFIYLDDQGQFFCSSMEQAIISGLEHKYESNIETRVFVDRLNHDTMISLNLIMSLISHKLWAHIATNQNQIYQFVYMLAVCEKMGLLEPGHYWVLRETLCEYRKKIEIARAEQSKRVYMVDVIHTGVENCIDYIDKIVSPNDLTLYE